MTKAHTDQIAIDGHTEGYSIKVGKTLPKNSVNLAYVDSSELNPLEILTIQKEQSFLSNAEEKTTNDIYFPDQDFRLRKEDGKDRLSSNELFITDEFSIPKTRQESSIPLYYQAEIKGYFDARNASVTEYVSGLVKEPIRSPKNYNTIAHTAPDELLYLGAKITITHLDGTALPGDFVWKVKLLRQEGQGVPTHAYKAFLYTNFRGNKEETYLVRYEKYNQDGTHKKDHTETLNAYAFFEEVDKETLMELSKQPNPGGEWSPKLKEKKYAVEALSTGEYALYAPSQVFVATSATRPAHHFSYRVTGRVKAKLSSANPGKIKIGIAYLNQAVFNVEDLTGVVKKIYESKYRAPYLEFENPHPPLAHTGMKENPSYWKVDLSMTEEHLYDYDLILITGYGNYNMASHNEALRHYLEQGGTVWIDNATSGNNRLRLQNFFLNVSFSTTDVTGAKAEGIGNRNNEFLKRLYLIQGNDLKIGYQDIGSKILFGAGEEESFWQQAVRHTTGDPSIIYRNVFEKGTVLFSNCGVLRAISHNEADDIRLAMNVILTTVEEKWFFSPWLKDYVFHKDNLFEQEYKIQNKELYIDDKSDLDTTQIVAKKIIKKTVREGLMPYTDPSYYSAKGTFNVEVRSNTDVFLANSEFEVGSWDAASDRHQDTWTISKEEAIPNWGTRITAGAGVFKHDAAITQRGTKAVLLDADNNPTGLQGHWYTTKENLEGGTYKLEVWIKTQDVEIIHGTGAAIGVYDANGVLISSSPSYRGTMDWTKVTISFGLTEMKSITIRLGFLDGRVGGKAWFDSITLSSMGSVHMTPTNDGSKALYAYTIRPKASIFDLQSRGFTYADVTLNDPALDVVYTIRSFVYAWDNLLNRYVRKYGKYMTRKQSIRQSQGNVNVGNLSTLLPELQAGAEWADRNNVFFEIFMGSPDIASPESHFINVGFFNTRTGQYYFSKAGENVIGWRDIFSTAQNDQNTIIVQMWTNYYTIAATKRRYGVQLNTSNKIELEYPVTLDERDCWYPRIRNGSYRATGKNAALYNLPEYDRQAFAPAKPYKKITEEMATFINPTTIRVQHTPLYIQQGVAQMEKLTSLEDASYDDGRSRSFKGSQGNWVKTTKVRVWVEQGEDGTLVELLSGFDVNYEDGMIILEEGHSQDVVASYEYNNLLVMKRKYQNHRIIEEPLGTSDNRTFSSKHTHWLSFPSPTIYILPNGQTKPMIVPIHSYEVDYETGTIFFYEEIREQVLASYAYSENEKLYVQDYDIQNGLLYLSAPITFRDEIVVSYHYEEQFVEYRGYYDEALHRFISLDLNPSEGHFCTLPISFKGKRTSFEKVPTAQLLNKSIYIYVLPYRDGLNRINAHPLRHCFSEKEWKQIKAYTPSAILLGTIYVRHRATVDDVVVLDARQRGGGLKESVSKEIMDQRQPLSHHYWDIGKWDGEAYYVNGVLVIQLPKTVLQREGGRFTEKEVEEAVRKYMAYGTYPIIEYV